MAFLFQQFQVLPLVAKEIRTRVKYNNHVTCTIVFSLHTSPTYFPSFLCKHLRF